MIRRVLVNNAVLGVQYAANAVVPLVLVPHIVRSIGISAFGSVALMLAWAGIAAVVVQYAFQLTGPKRIAQSSSGAGAAAVFLEISMAKILLLVLALPLIVAAAWVSLPGDMNWPHVMLLVGLPVAAALNSAWFLLARDKPTSIGIVALLGNAIAMIVGFVIVTGPDTRSLWGVSFAMISGPLLSGAATLIVACWLVRTEKFPWSEVRPAHALREGWPLFGSQFAATLYAASGPIVVNHFAGLGAAGVYSAVERFFNALMAGCLLTHTAAYPRLAVAYRTDRAAYLHLLKSVVGIYLALTVLLVVGVPGYRDELSLFLLGDSSSQGRTLIAWASVWLVIGVFGPALTGYLTVSGRAAAVMPLTLRVLAVSLLLGVPSAIAFGGAGWMASLVLAQAIVLHAAYRYWRTADAT